MYRSFFIEEFQRHRAMSGRASGPERSRHKSCLDQLLPRGSGAFRSFCVHLNAVRALRGTGHRHRNQFPVFPGNSAVIPGRQCC